MIPDVVPKKDGVIVLRIGIDFGGVLSIHDAKSSESQHHNISVDVPGAIDTLRLWKAQGHELYLISFCGRARSAETRASIEKTAAGLFTELYFTRTKKYKADLCNHIGCHLMIDDRKDILKDIKARAPLTNRYWFEGRENEWETLNVLLQANLSSGLFTNRAVPQSAATKMLKKWIY